MKKNIDAMNVNFLFEVFIFGFKKVEDKEKTEALQEDFMSNVLITTKDAFAVKHELERSSRHLEGSDMSNDYLKAEDATVGSRHEHRNMKRKLKNELTYET